jgi:hypothetical protein
MRPRLLLSAAIGVVLATAGTLLQTPAPPPRQVDVSGLLPAGAALVLEARDFSSLLGDWTASSEKQRWLASDNYQAFSRSRLFLRLKEAYVEFATAAGVPVDMALLADIAGSDSALAIYDIGKLEFLYITRLPSATMMENALWRTRGSYEPRQAAGTPFYVRIDRESKRLVAFGTRDQYLLLATREDLLAGALSLIGRQGGASVQSEGWFAQSVAASRVPGDLRLVLNLDALVKEPHFRSYWIQDNVSELKPFRSGVSDLVRTPTEIREERVLFRSEEQPVAGEPAALGDITRLVPDSAGLYRAWVAPPADAATRLIFSKILAPSASSTVRDRTAPTVVLTSGVTGGAGDLESRIDEEARPPRSIGYEIAALEQLIGRTPPVAMLQVESTRAGSDGVFVNRGAVIVVARQSDWPPGAARDAIRAVVEPVWTKAQLGMRWDDVRVGAQSFSQMEGLEPIAVAERGRLLFVGNDPALLVSVLELVSTPPLAVQGVYAGGFRHTLERGRFVGIMRLIDHAAARGEHREPLFFSENLASLSDTLSRVEAASIVVRDAGRTVSQTVTYRTAR